ncbi:protein NYNRIN-like, partial [Acinonyx jubatus]|uniref:Protein NYNRIN-like n=1 Tax=Acinonyx jubatus TaxID=32536 RepID=A0ABM3QB10_ACIJB
QNPIQVLPAQLPDPGPRDLPPQPEYSEDDLIWMRKLPMTQVTDGWWRDSRDRLILPEKLGHAILTKIHHSTHVGPRRLQDLLRQSKLVLRNISDQTERVVTACATCQLQNAHPHVTAHGHRKRGTIPGAHWEVDFTEVKPGKYGYKYLLVFVDTFSGWTEAFPTKKETAQIVAKKILEEILPRYGFPVMIGSDNGPAFVSKVSQGLASILGADWKLHCAYRPQSSGQVERMNRTLKETLTKLTMETGANWIELLPYALYRVRNSPYKLGLTPYEIMFGRPTPIIPNLKSNLIQLDQDNSLLSSLRALQRVHEAVWPKLKELYEAELPPTPHQYHPGDWVLVKRHRQENLEPRWKGPHQIILTTPTAIKVDNLPTWIHHTHVKPVDPLSDLVGRTDKNTTWTVNRSKKTPLKLTLRRASPKTCSR